MLESIYTSKVLSRFLFLKDIGHNSGKSLLKSFTSMALAQGRNVIFVTYDTSPEELRQKYDIFGERMTIVDGYSDPLLWEGTETHCTSTIGYDVGKLELGISSGGLLVVDSLTPPLLASPAQSLYRAIHKLMADSKVEQLVASVNEDVHAIGDIQLIEHLAQTIVTMIGPSTCQVLHKKTSGKASKTKEVFTIGKNDELRSQEIKQSENSSVWGGATNNADDVTKDLTFNLNLKETEKLARENLVLPYTRGSEKRQPTTGSKIFYNLDDFDEEDPDEDLEI